LLGDNRVYVVGGLQLLPSRLALVPKAAQPCEHRETPLSISGSLCWGRDPEPGLPLPGPSLSPGQARQPIWLALWRWLLVGEAVTKQKWTQQEVSKEINEAGGKIQIGVIPQTAARLKSHQDGWMQCFYEMTQVSCPLGSQKTAFFFLACLRSLNELIWNTLSAEPAEFSSRNCIIP
jgi:hypothetical protein